MKLLISRSWIAPITGCALFLLLGGFSGRPLGAQGPNSEFQRQLLLAQKLYQSGDLDNAIATYRQAIRLNLRAARPIPASGQC